MNDESFKKCLYKLQVFLRNWFIENEEWSDFLYLDKNVNLPIHPYYVEMNGWKGLTCSYGVESL